MMSIDDGSLQSRSCSETVTYVPKLSFEMSELLTTTVEALSGSNCAACCVTTGRVVIFGRRKVAPAVGIARVPIADTKGRIGLSPSYTLPVIISGKMPGVLSVLIYGATPGAASTRAALMFAFSCAKSAPPRP